MDEDWIVIGEEQDYNQVKFKHTGMGDDVVIGYTRDDDSNVLVQQDEREELGRLLLEDVDGVTVVDDDDDDDGDDSSSLTEGQPEWFDPSTENVTQITIPNQYDHDKWVVDKGKTYTIVEKVGEKYRHLQLHEKDVPQLIDVIGDGGGDRTAVENGECAEDDGCVCGNDECDGLHTSGEKVSQTDDSPPIVHDSEDGITFSSSVSLDTAVDVDGATDKQRRMYDRLAELCESNYETLVEKNMSYGDSAMNTTVGHGGLFDTEFQANCNGLLVRLSDKQSRLENLLLNDGEDCVDESAMDTALDLANYGLLLAYLIDSQ